MWFYKFLLKILGGDDMVALYVALIINGKRTFKSVPDKLKDAVRNDLAALGLDENGNPITTE